MSRLTIIILFFTFLSCSEKKCEHANEIPYVHLISNKLDSEKLCNYYDANRKYFFEQKNSLKSNADENIKQRLDELNLSKESLETFFKYWKEDAELHRERTLNRDAKYIEGTTCLQQLLEKDIPEFEIYVANAEKKLSQNLTDSEKKEIEKGINNYLAFTEKKKQQFFEEESLLYGQLGNNIVTYSQLSFEVINKILTSEYRFGFKGDFKNRMLEIISNNENLKNEFEIYKEKENELVKKITSENCLKRVGVLRYYDQLNEERKNKAMKINMLLNIFKERRLPATMHQPH